MLCHIVFFADLEVVLNDVVAVDDDTSMQTLFTVLTPSLSILSKDNHVQRSHFAREFGRETKDNKIATLPGVWFMAITVTSK
jgi:hypothetical protein